MTPEFPDEDDFMPSAAEAKAAENFKLVAAGLTEVVDAVMALLREKVAAVMHQHGENPGDPYLFGCRVRQAAYSVDSIAAREWREAGGP